MHYTHNDYLLLHLSLIDGVGPVTVMRISEHILHEESNQLYAMSPHEIALHYSLSLTQARVIATGLMDRKLLDHTCETMAKNSISWMTMATASYPSLLKNIYAPPPVLYWRGVFPPSEHTIAVVGSRKANAYGQRVIDRLLPDFIQAGGTVISGGALGIDTMAHRKSLALQGYTIVVLGSGLLHWYPYENKKLFQEIIDTGGCITTPFPPTVQPYPGNFPARNRIIAGLAHITLVVQASQKSGALITAQYALDQGREVMAVPGPIDDPLCQGCNALIAQGATVATDASSIIQALGLSQHTAQRPSYQRSVVSACTAEPATRTTLNMQPEDQLLALCEQPRSTNELINAGIVSDQDRLIELLFDLQLTGKIQQDLTGHWRSVG